MESHCYAPMSGTGAVVSLLLSLLFSVSRSLALFRFAAPPSTKANERDKEKKTKKKQEREEERRGAGGRGRGDERRENKRRDRDGNNYLAFIYARRDSAVCHSLSNLCVSLFSLAPSHLFRLVPPLPLSLLPFSLLPFSRPLVLVASRAFYLSPFSFFLSPSFLRSALSSSRD